MEPRKKVTGFAKKSSDRHFLSRVRSRLMLAFRSASNVSCTTFSSGVGVGFAAVTFVKFSGSIGDSCERMLARSVLSRRRRSMSASLLEHDCDSVSTANASSRSSPSSFICWTRFELEVIFFTLGVECLICLV